jgi:nucleotidyltransferase substrate binding protein (TIGR01987 family)
MSRDKFKELLSSLEKAVNRFAEVLEMGKSDIIRDSAIKRFEIAFDLSWKTIKACLETKGVICRSPKSCFEEAYQEGLIEYEDIWLQMIDMRNKTAHTYNEGIAEEIYAGLSETLKTFQKLLETLRGNK